MSYLYDVGAKKELATTSRHEGSAWPGFCCAKTKIKVESEEQV